MQADVWQVKTFSSTATSLKFGEYNRLASIFTLLFIYCLEFIFKESFLPPDSYTNTVNLRPVGRSTQNATRGAIFFEFRGLARTSLTFLSDDFLPANGINFYLGLPPICLLAALQLKIYYCFSYFPEKYSRWVSVRKFLDQRELCHNIFVLFFIIKIYC